MKKKAEPKTSGWKTGQEVSVHGMRMTVIRKHSMRYWVCLHKGEEVLAPEELMKEVK